MHMIQLDFDALLTNPIFDIFGKDAVYKPKNTTIAQRNIRVLDRTDTNFEVTNGKEVEKNTPFLVVKRSDITDNHVGDSIIYLDKEYIIKASQNKLIHGQKTGEVELTLIRKRAS